MELDDLKATWQDINRRLEKNEIMNRQIIEKMIVSRTSSAYDRLMRYEKRILILCIFCMIYFLWPLILDIFGIYVIVLTEFIMIYCVLEQLYKIRLLKKMNLTTDSVYDVISRTLHYQKITMNAMKIGTFIIITVFIIACSFGVLTNPENNFILWGVYAGAIVGLILGLSTFNKHKKDIDELMKALDDLKTYQQE